MSSCAVASLAMQNRSWFNFRLNIFINLNSELISKRCCYYRVFAVPCLSIHSGIVFWKQTKQKTRKKQENETTLRDSKLHATESISFCIYFIITVWMKMLRDLKPPKGLHFKSCVCLCVCGGGGCGAQQHLSQMCLEMKSVSFCNLDFFFFLYYNQY